MTFRRLIPLTLALGSLLFAACAGSSEAGRQEATQPIPPALRAAQEALPANATPEAQAEWILLKVDAASGAEAARLVGSRVLTSHVTLPAVGMQIDSVSYQLGMDKVYVRQDMPGMGVSEVGYDGQIGWSNDPLTGLRQREGTELEAVRRLTLGCEADFRASYSAWTLKAVDEEGGRVYYRLALTPKVGEVEIHDVDAQTFLTWRTVTVLEGVQGKVTVRSEIRRWEAHDGVMVPMEEVSTVGPMEMISVVRSIQHGVEVDPSLFTMPEATP